MFGRQTRAPGGRDDRNVLVVGRELVGVGRHSLPGNQAQAYGGEAHHRRAPSLSHHAQTVAIAAATFLLALDGGGYSLGARAAAAAVAWTFLLIALVAFDETRPPVAVWVVGGALGALALITGLSLLWASSGEKAFIELDRVLLYVGIFALVARLATRVALHRWLLGIGAGIAAICLLSLIGRFFPSTNLNDSLHTLLPSIGGRLTYPLGYWNGLGIFAALGTTSLLGASVSVAGSSRKALSLLPVPLFVAVIYMTSSRGAVAVAVIGALTLFTLAPRRLEVLAAVVAASVGGAVVVLVLLAHPTLVNNPAKAGSEPGRVVAALLVLAGCVMTAGVRLLISETGLDRLRIPRPLTSVLAAVCLVAVIVGVIAADPSRRLAEFKARPNSGAQTSPDYVRTHLLSGGGSGRWQFWSAALAQFRAHPLNGGGAGSYETWWMQHGSFAYTVHDAHSLWLQTLGELGVLGIVPLALAFGGALAFGAWRLRAVRPSERVAVASLIALLVGWMLGAAVDWIWELAAVGAIGVAALALLCARSSEVRDGAAGTERRAALVARGSGALRRLLLPAAFLGTILIICAAALPWMVGREAGASQTAARAHNWPAAIARAQDARALQPWAASPYVQLALVEAASGNTPAATRAIAQATARDPNDWSSWFVAAAIATQARNPQTAAIALRHAQVLNPKSALLRG